MVSEIVQQAAEIIRRDDWLPPEAEQFLKPDATDEGECEQGERVALTVRLALEVQRLAGGPFELPKRDVTEFLKVSWASCLWFPVALERGGILRCVRRGNESLTSLYVYTGQSYQPGKESSHAHDLI